MRAKLRAVGCMPLLGAASPERAPASIFPQLVDYARIYREPPARIKVDPPDRHLAQIAFRLPSKTLPRAIQLILQQVGKGIDAIRSLEIFHRLTEAAIEKVLLPTMTHDEYSRDIPEVAVHDFRLA